MIWLWFALLRLLFLDTDGGNGNGNGDGDQPPDDEEEEIRNPLAKIKALERQINHRAKREKKKDALIEQLQSQLEASGDLRAARLEVAFLRAVMASEPPITDIETAWELAQMKGFLDPVKDDGEGMPEALTRLLERYPYLADEDSEPESAPAPRKEGGRAFNRDRRPASIAAGRATLAERFPALKRGR